MGRFLNIVAKDLIDIWDAAGLVWAYIRIGIDKMAIFVTKLFKKNYVEPMGASDSIDNLYRTLPDTPQALLLSQSPSAYANQKRLPRKLQLNSGQEKTQSRA